MRGQRGVVPHHVLQARHQVGADRQRTQVEKADGGKREHNRGGSALCPGHDHGAQDVAERKARNDDGHDHPNRAQVNAIELAGACREREGRRAEARVAVLVLLETLVRQRPEQPEREHCRQRPQHEYLVGLGVAAGEGKAQAAVAGIGHAEAQRAHQQQREHRQ
ncbi:hypothetical protein D3C72_1702300 [compost metagenome]